MAKKIGVRTATTTAAGVVKVGDGLSVTDDGTLSASGGSDVDIIAPTTVGTGTKPSATGTNAIAFGAEAKASARNSIAIGYRANQAASTVGDESVAIGYDVGNGYRTGDRSVSIGYGAAAMYENSVAIGSYALATDSYVFTVGDDSMGLLRRVTAVGTPTKSTDAATKGYVDGQTILANVTDSTHFDTDNSQVRIGYVNGAYHVVSGCLITKKIGATVTIAQIPLDVDAVTTASLPTAYFTGLCFKPNSDSLDSAGTVFRYAMKLGRTSAGKLCIDFVNGGAAIGSTYQESITF